jgi:tRNA (guanine10-N2)-methyltransferase
MLDDILQFAADYLVDDGRISMWMPTANDEEVELDVPMHEELELVSTCIQVFNKWSRRLLTYRRRRSEEIVARHGQRKKGEEVLPNGARANELNNFRKRYFQGFVAPEEAEKKNYP